MFDWKSMWRWTIAFSVVGVLFATWIAPKTIAWYFEPPAALGISCKPSIEWALAKLQYAQIVGLLIGAGSGLILKFIFRKRNPNQVPVRV